jgi:iron complex outermembrane receptor protein
VTDNALRGRLLASSMICGAALVLLEFGPASAQAAAGGATPQAPAAASASPGATPGEIVVTGSRIPQSANLASVSPVQVVSAQEVVLGGRPVTVDFLNQLPQIQQNSQTALSSTSNPLSGPGGVATVDLRGLGQTRTLVLMDGRRLGIGDPNTGNPNPSPDINQIPSQLIDRVEVLTGGASATYGSDAIAGVVNFIMKRNFTGLQVDGQWSIFQHGQHNKTMQRLLRDANIPVPGDAWDGAARDVAITFGMNFNENRGNLVGYFTYHDQDPVTQGRRDYSACQLNVGDTGTPFCAGSSNSNIFYLASGLGNAYAVVGKNFALYDQAATTTPPPLFNSNAYAHLLQQDTRYTAGFFARYELSPHLETYSDFQFMDDRTNVQIAPTGLFQGSGATATGGFNVNCNNPFLSAQQQAAIGCTAADIAAGNNADLYIGRRNIEGGGRNSFYEHQNFRFVLGGRGEIAGPWRYDIYGSYYYTTLYQASQNYLSISRIQNALQVVQGANGPVCISGGSCVPYNIFQEGGVTPAALQYLDITGTSRGAVSQRIIEATITGDLGQYGIRSPLANDGVRIAVGLQSRREHLDYAPDVALLSGDLSGAGGASTPIDATIRVNEGYAEARLPLAQDRPFLHDLSAELGYRYSDYSTGIVAHTYKLGLEWAPVRDIRLRASYQKAIRAPNILELFTPQAVTNTSQLSEDPCAANATHPATLAQCQNTGVTPGQYGIIPQCPSGQCAVLTGGSTNLQAERAKTYSVGLIFTPTFAPGLNATLDYYRIDLKGTIGTVPLGIVMQRCLDTGDPQFCSMIVRSSNGALFGSSVTTGGYIVGTSVNVGAGTASGIDLQANYSMPLERIGWDNGGRIAFNLAGSYLMKATTTPLPGEAEYDCAGLFGPQCQTVNPRWRHTFRLTWTSPWQVTVSGAWRYFGGATLETDTNQPTIGQGTTDPFNHRLPARNYFDLSFLWTVKRAVDLRVGVNNIFDQDPPLVNSLIAGTGLPNTYPSYDLLGRKVFVGLTARF